MKPQIEFRHVLGELSVNRNDPCEVLRELISNSYDASAKQIFYAPIKSEDGFIFFDDGHGLDTQKKVNGITPYEAFFSIGKSTKKKGDAIGYKCQGSKLCFACGRILVASKSSGKDSGWSYKIIDNPRKNLDTGFDITPKINSDLSSILTEFVNSPSAENQQAIDSLLKLVANSDSKTGTLIYIEKLDVENFGRHFTFSKKIEESYVYNYVRFYTRHGDTKWIDKAQGFSANHISQISAKIEPAKFTFYGARKAVDIPYGFPYLETKSADSDIKSPSAVARLRDGRFFTRAAKSFNISGGSYSVMLAIDGNRRAHEEYPNLDRKGKAKSGIRLSEQRGLFISVNGIKICRYPDLLSSLDEYHVLAEGESPMHYTLIVDGEFDLVTNRNSLSKKAFDTLSDPDFLREIKKFLDNVKKGDAVFSELLSRLRRESTENKLNEQMEILDSSISLLKSRERFRVDAPSGESRLFLSPMPGEEYWVGVLYATLGQWVSAENPQVDYWKKVITFSTQGIDSLGLKQESSPSPLAKENIATIEYKYQFSNTGPFNHALAIVDYIIAWEVDVDVNSLAKDTYTCFGSIRPIPNVNFEWEIFNIESDEGGVYKNTVKVICLRDLIKETFGINYVKP
ncbi:ATP-binding protein [Chitinimonas taiwanensis]|uniref:Histidine kinase-, DNA gyrase B-, and HSP90-like ATPase n=1 Tax=Chitinimonas taiwanensis DSM 18899 TaxID=1121279 RepID=A0A1K2HPU8_9NEIS|nr:ATP-binding protein [Chitinimonas taiwanensis]SFZ78783.1 hypothetical protein SAMN02745887_03184 [Chitinimonas taiwanensis DSM 18899]